MSLWLHGFSKNLGVIAQAAVVAAVVVLVVAVVVVLVSLVVVTVVVAVVLTVVSVVVVVVVAVVSSGVGETTPGSAFTHKASVSRWCAGDALFARSDAGGSIPGRSGSTGSPLGGRVA